MDSASQFISWLASNPWYVLITSVLAVVGVAWGFISFFVGRRVKAPCYVIRSNNIVRQLSAKIPSIEIRYSGQPIENLTSTKIAFWNAGRETIRREDVASLDPISFRIESGFKLLDAQIVFEKNHANRCAITLSPDQSQAVLDFEFLDKNDGVVVQLLHTGVSTQNVHVAGVVKGAQRLKRKSARPDPSLRVLRKRTRTQERVVNILIAAYVTAVIGLFLFVPSEPPDESLVVQIAKRLAVVAPILLVVLGVVLLRVGRLPKGFDAFDEDT